MRIKVLKSTTVRDFEDHRRHDVFQAGTDYDVEKTIGALFVTEGWAEPAESDADDPAVEPRDVRGGTR
jgi:hypothetical protein